MTIMTNPAASIYMNLVFYAICISDAFQLADPE